jgi:hypothetical protein
MRCGASAMRLSLAAIPEAGIAVLIRGVTDELLERYSQRSVQRDAAMSRSKQFEKR